jgi:nucleotide-binding universal stress UspA family protein
LHLLVSIKDESDIACLVRSVQNFIVGNTSVKVILLHVIETAYPHGDAHPLFQAASAGEECRAALVINEASQHLRNANIAFDAYIRQGDAGSEILDAAEMFDCSAIILRERKAKSWSKLLSHGVIHKVVNSSRSAPVVIVDADGIAKKCRD